MAVEHLIETGRSRIAFAGGPIGDKQIGERLDGAKKAADANQNVSFDIMPTSNLTVLEGRRIGQEIIAREAKSRPDAVFAANDLLAIGILQAVLMSGELTIPKDFALIGYDDIWFAETAIVPLSTVRQPSTEIGLHAVKLLIEEAESDGAAHPQQIVFQPALVIRDSTSPTNHL